MYAKKMALSTGTTTALSVCTAINGQNYKVVVGAEIFNHTKYLLTMESFYTVWGHLEKPPVNIEPETNEIFVARKTAYTTTGSTVVAVWKIEDGSNTRMVVMWSAPWNQTFHPNVLSMGFKSEEVRADKELYKEMYKENSDTWYCKKNYSNTAVCEQARKNCERYKLHGSMGTSHKCEAKIELFTVATA